MVFPVSRAAVRAAAFCFMCSAPYGAEHARAQELPAHIRDSFDFYNLQLYGDVVRPETSGRFIARRDTPPPPPAPVTEDSARIYSYTLENDAFAGRDDGYTSGFRLAVLGKESDVTVLGIEGKKRFSIAAGQSIFSPRNLKTRLLQKNDRPYAGWAYVSAGMVSDAGTHADNFLITAGIAGPSAKAKETQEFIHDLTHATRPRGWDNQLKDEPGVILSYGRTWRDVYGARPFGLELDATPSLSASLGNIHTNASLGAVFRLGRDLPSDYGPPLIRPSLPGSDFFVPSRAFGWYLFSGAEARLVGHNLFLDGNTFTDSHSVEKKPFVAGVQSGAVITYKRARLGYTHVFRTKEFKTQKTRDAFGAVTFSYRF